MGFRNPYPRGADPSVFPTIDVMRSAYLEVRYRDYPRAARVPVGPWTWYTSGPDARAGVDFTDTRIRAHAVVVVPGKMVLLRFARRAALADLDSLDRERELMAQTPELAPACCWAIEARLVYCDAFDGIEDAARVRGVRLARYLPALLLRWRDAAGREPGIGIHARAFDPVSLRAYVERHTRQPESARKAATTAARGCLPVSTRQSEAQRAPCPESAGGGPRTTGFKS